MDSGCYATTGLTIKHVLTGQEHTVWHLQYTDWPDHGCPEDFKGFLCEWISWSNVYSNQEVPLRNLYSKGEQVKKAVPVKVK